MKVGDLVRYKSAIRRHVWRADEKRTGVIIETGIYTGNRDLKVMWERMNLDTEISDNLEVINEDW